MKWFIKLKLVQKLFLSFGITAALTIVIGVVGIIRIGDVGSLMHSLYTNNLLAIQALANAQSAVVVHSRGITRLPMEEQKAAEETIERGKEHLKILTEQLKIYRATELSEAEINYIKDLDVALPAYLEVAQRIRDAERKFSHQWGIQLLLHRPRLADLHGVGKSGVVRQDRRDHEPAQQRRRQAVTILIKGELVLRGDGDRMRGVVIRRSALGPLILRIGLIRTRAGSFVR